MQGKKMGADLSRKDFLKLGGAGLAGAALLGTAGCGGSSGSGDLVLSWGPDDDGEPAEADKAVQPAEQGLQGHIPGDAGRYGPVLRQAQDPVPGRRRRHRPHTRGRHLACPVRGQRLDRGPLRPLQGHRTLSCQVRCSPRPTRARSGPSPGTRTPGSCTTGRISSRNPATRSPPRPGRAPGDGRQGNERPGHRATASSSRGTSTRAGCATAASTSGPPAATSSTPTTHPRSS